MPSTRAAASGHHVEGERELVVVPEVGAIADQHGAFQHVAVAEGRPGIADIVGAAEHLDAMLAQELQRRHGAAARAVAHDGDAGLGQQVGRARGQLGRHRAQREGMADRDLALQARRRACARRWPASGRCRLRRRRADGCRCRRRAARRWRRSRRDGRRGRRRCRRDRGRPKGRRPAAMASSSSSAVPGERRMPLCGKATIWMVTRSRKRSRTFRICVEVPEAELVVDVDVAAHVQRAAGHDLAHQIGAGLGLGHGARRAYLAFGLDAVGDAVAGRLVGHPGQAEQGLVEMDVAVDQRRQDAARRRDRGRPCREAGRRAAIRPP